MVVCPLAQTCSDIMTHRATLHLLDYGVKHLLRAATGTTSNVREAGKREDRKSIGVERTFKDLWKKEDLIAKLEDIAEHLCEDMEQLHFTARCLSLKFKTHDYKRAFSSLHLFTHCGCSPIFDDPPLQSSLETERSITGSSSQRRVSSRSAYSCLGRICR